MKAGLALLALASLVSCWGQEVVMGADGEVVQGKGQEGQGLGQGLGHGLGKEGQRGQEGVSYIPNVRVTSQHWSVQPLETRYRATTAMNARFRSISPKKLQIWYDDGKGGTKMGHLGMGQETTTNTYEGHDFFFTDYVTGLNKPEIFRATMRNDQVMYVVEDFNNPAPDALRQSTYNEANFMDAYLNRTGIHWRHYYGPEGPRPPPVLPMWGAEVVGQVHGVRSTEKYWQCAGTSDDCKSPAAVDLELQVISLAPRAFVIENFLSSFEAGEIVRLAGPRMEGSIVGDVTSGSFSSSTRTSKNGWLERSASPIIESLFKRAAHLLMLSDAHLSGSNTEHLQVVSYQDGQKYDSHHDWGVSGYPESRLITLLLYLTDMEDADAGGETAFPKADGRQGIKVHPGKGGAVLFYNLLEDGNGDDLALHAALPIKRFINDHVIM